MRRMEIEEALRTIETQAAMLRYLADNAADSDEPLGRAALQGIGTSCESIEELTRSVKRTLPADMLALIVRAT